VYGSDAVAGVVQLFTRSGAGSAHGFLNVRGGSYGSLDGEGGVAGGTPKFRYSAGASSRQTDGFLPFNNDFLNRTASARLSFAPSFASVDVTARRSDATYHFPTDGSGAVVDSNSVRRDHRTVLGLDAIRHLTSRVDLRLLGATTRLDGGSSNDPDSPGDSAGFYSHDDSRIERRSADLHVRRMLTRGEAIEVAAGLYQRL
jgi:vitamin B12 transporter